MDEHLSTRALLLFEDREPPKADIRLVKRSLNDCWRRRSELESGHPAIRMVVAAHDDLLLLTAPNVSALQSLSDFLMKCFGTATENVIPLPMQTGRNRAPKLCAGGERTHSCARSLPTLKLTIRSMTRCVS